jgi:hypothetical protein
VKKDDILTLIGVSLDGELEEAAHHAKFGGKSGKLLLTTGSGLIVFSSNRSASTHFFFGAIGPCCEILVSDPGASAKQKRLNNNRVCFVCSGSLLGVKLTRGFR